MRDRHSVDEAVKRPVPVFPDMTDTPITIGNQAVMPAEMAMNLVVIQLFVK
jgi:hypothetical protein